MAQVEKDGSFKMIDFSTRGGRAFFGLGSLQTGFKVNHCKDKTFTIGYVCFIVHLRDCLMLFSTESYQIGAYIISNNV